MEAAAGILAFVRNDGRRGGEGLGGSRVKSSTLVADEGDDVESGNKACSVDIGIVGGELMIAMMGRVVRRASRAAGNTPKERRRISSRLKSCLEL